MRMVHYWSDRIWNHCGCSVSYFLSCPCHWPCRLHRMLGCSWHFRRCRHMAMLPAKQMLKTFRPVNQWFSTRCKFVVIVPLEITFKCSLLWSIGWLVSQVCSSSWYWLFPVKPYTRNTLITSKPTVKAQGKFQCNKDGSVSNS